MAAEENVTTEEKPPSQPPAPEPPNEAPKEEAKVEAKPTGYSPAPLSVPPAGTATSDGKKKKKKKDVEIAIRITKVTKRFGVKTAVDGVSFKVKAGTVYGLIGPNGAGKTTTFSMLAGFLQPTAQPAESQSTD